jgi:hypothetical protein
MGARRMSERSARAIAHFTTLPEILIIFMIHGVSFTLFQISLLCAVKKRWMKKKTYKIENSQNFTNSQNF